MSERRAVRVWDLLHTWSSLVCTLFLLVLCITGLPLIFADEIDAALAPTPALETSLSAPPLSIDALIARVAVRRPDRVAQFVYFDDGTQGIGLGLAPRNGADLSEIDRVMFDAATATPIPEAAPESGLTATLLEIHSSLLVGPIGELVIACVALAFLISLISGVVLYAPFLRGRAFGAVRAASARVRWLDLHNFIGIACCAWLLVVGATGLMNALEGPLFSAWNGELMARIMDANKTGATPDHVIGADAALAAARAAKPGMTATSIGFPGSEFATPRHYMIWLKGATKLTENYFTPVLIDAADGHVASASPLPWYLRALETSRPLHFGDYGGLALKLVWAAFDALAIFVLGSGFYLWLVRRAAPRASPETA